MSGTRDLGLALLGALGVLLLTLSVALDNGVLECFLHHNDMRKGLLGCGLEDCEDWVGRAETSHGSSQLLIHV